MAPENSKDFLFEAFSEVRAQIESAGIVKADIQRPAEITRFAVETLQ